MDEEFRVIPGYEKYGVTMGGTIKSFERDSILGRYLLNGYWIVDTFRGSKTETLPVHRAVALAWVENLDPENLIVVNHIDGNPLNNWFQNLEWTTHSGNNYHAVKEGLRKDNIPCRVRNFATKEVLEFPSIAQAAEHMGMSKDAPICQLRPKKFGALINNQFEFRFGEDETPWFYERRSEKIVPSRYEVTVVDEQGDVREFYSARDLLKEFQLYGSPYGKSVPALTRYGNECYPHLNFSVRDSYLEEQFRRTRQTARSVRMRIQASNGNEQQTFYSLTQCAKHHDVDRSSIMNRLDNGKDLDGWTFTSLPL